MPEKVLLILPEIALFITTCVVMVIGLSPSAPARRGVAWIAAIGLVVAGALAGVSAPAATGLFPSITPYAKGLVAVVGLLLVMLLAGTVDRDEEERIAARRASFNALSSNRAEFFAFFLFSLTGLMLVASADDLIWLFLALELTSLPTYIMVTISTRGQRSQEAGVKYFFLGALGAAIFLYGFALIYGATGSTDLAAIALAFRDQAVSGGINPIGIAGLVIAAIGLGFKIAAVPMHFYTPDVYQGASSTVSAMLAFVPKAAGFIALILLCGAAGWVRGRDQIGLPEPLYYTLWIMAAASMTAGNVMALLQSSVKRMLAYSSIAHSGYMLCGLIVGPALVPGIPGPDTDTLSADGVAGVLFYLLCYGVMGTGTFAVLACFERARSGDIDEIDDLRGLSRRHPHLAAAMLICVLGLVGFPPLLGFIGKAVLITPVISAGEIALAVVLLLNSAAAAFYYLRLAVAVYLDPRDEERTASLAPTPFPTRTLAALFCAGGVVVLIAFTGPLTAGALRAADYRPPSEDVIVNADAASHPLPTAPPDREPH